MIVAVAFAATATRVASPDVARRSRCQLSNSSPVMTKSTATTASAINPMLTGVLSGGASSAPDSGSPQRLQNSLPSGFSVWQFEQTIIKHPLSDGYSFTWRFSRLTMLAH